MTKKKLKQLVEVRENLFDTLEQLRTGEISTKEAGKIAKAANRKLRTMKAKRS